MAISKITSASLDQSSGAPAWDASGNTTLTGNLTISGTGKRITGDFSNATHTSRVLVQTSTANANTILGIIPNGTATTAQLNLYYGSDPTNTSCFQLSTQSDRTVIASSNTGSGSYLPLTFYTSSSERLRIDTAGKVGIGTSSPADTLDIYSAAGTAAIRMYTNGPGSLTWRLGSQLIGVDNGGFVIRDETNAVNRFAITATGDIAIGTNAPNGKLTIGDGSITYKNSATSTSTVRELFNYVITTPSSATTNGLSVGFRTGDAFPNRGASVRMLQTGNSDVYGEASTAVSIWTYNNGYDNGAERVRVDANTLSLSGLQGIKFQASQNASSDANTLDDYEEGTWTPTLSALSTPPTVTYASQAGKYTKIGNVVTVHFLVQLASFSGGSGVIDIATLPFACNSTIASMTAVYSTYITFGASRTYVVAYIPSGATYMRFIACGSGVADNDIAVGAMAANSTLWGTVTYLTST